MILPGAAATMFLLSRIWDGINDPIMGMIADRTNTRWGKFRPYLLWLCVPFAVVGVFTFSVPDFVDLRDRSRSKDVAATRGGSFSLSGDFEAELLRGLYVTPGFFDVLEVAPVQGRGFAAEEGVPGNERVAIVSHGLWDRRFGRDPDLVGSSILLDGIPHTVVGVMPSAIGCSKRCPTRPDPRC